MNAVFREELMMMFHEQIKVCNHNFVMSVLDVMLELTEIIHSEKNFDDTYNEVINKISRLFGWDYGELWILDDKRNELTKSPIHYSKTDQSEFFSVESSEYSFAYGEGLPGKTWEIKKHIWIPNVQAEPAFIRSDLAKKHGLKTGITIPILAYDHVEAVIFLLSCEELNYDSLLVQLLEHIARNIGLTIVKSKLERQIKSFRETHNANELGYPLLHRLFLYRDPYTSHHQVQVADLAVDIAQNLGHDLASQSRIRQAAMIHDIGKINVPMEILSKPGILTQSELNLIREHPKLGYDIIKNIDMHESTKRIVLEHHEHLDGSGYPNHLKDHDILDETRILTVADVICAMLESRPYRTARTKSEVRKELLKFTGVFYSQEVVNVAINLLKDFHIVQTIK